MDKFYIITNSLKDVGLVTTEKICQYLERHQRVCSVQIADQKKEGPYHYTDPEKIPDDTDLVITHKELTGTAKAAQPNKQHLSITNYLQAPEYDELVERLKNR